MADVAKIFWTGRSQAVRLPKEYRFDADRVSIRRQGRGVYLEVADADYGSDDVADDAARMLDDLRALIAEGLNSGPAEEWDAAELKRLARERQAAIRP